MEKIESKALKVITTDSFELTKTSFRENASLNS